MLEALKDILFLTALFLMIKGVKQGSIIEKGRVTIVLLSAVAILIAMKYFLPEVFYKY